MREQCKFIRAAYPTMVNDDLMCAQHRHEPRVFDLARAMAVAFQNPTPSDEQIAWFLDDADAVVDDFDPTPDDWSVTPLEPTREAGLDGTLTINGEPYVVQASDWEPAHPVKRSTYVEWVGEDDEDETEGTS